MSRDDEITALGAEVAALRRTVEMLAELLVRAGTINDVERRDLIRAARRTRDTSMDDDDGNSGRAQPGHVLAGSPYRGASPIEGVGCALCGRALEADDPDLMLGRHGKVCTVCFTRGG